MTESVYIIGAYSSSFGKKLEQSYKQLTRETYLGVLADAGLTDGKELGAAWFSNVSLYLQGQSSIGGQVLFSPLVSDGLFPENLPLTNVHNACASGTAAVRGAMLDILSGQQSLSLAIGVEKLFDPERSAEEMARMFSGGIDQFDPDQWTDFYTQAGKGVGIEFSIPKNRSLFMDTYAVQAAWHMQQFGTTQEQLAIAASKTHEFGAQNARAQYRFEMTPQQILDDRAVCHPFTRSMCAPIGDGGAALLLASESFLSECEQSVRDRAIKILACEASGGRYRTLEEPSLTKVAAQKAFTRAAVQPQDLDLLEIHDATSFSEVYQLEMLGVCEVGKGGRFIEEGHAHLGGKLPVNTSGGLVSKGHPLGATGVSMLCELAEQLRGEAGTRQVANARLGATENAGGVIGFDEAISYVTILERSEQ